MKSAFAAFVLAAFTLMLFTGCGYKDKPVAPQYIVPQAVKDLRSAYSEDGVTLFWTYPAKTISGDEIGEILEFRLYYAEVAADDHCEGCPLPFDEPIIIPGGAVPMDGSKTTSYEFTALNPGKLYFFKVRSRNGWWTESKDSNVVFLLWYSPPLPPEGLTVEAGDTENLLNWQSVRQHRDTSLITRPVSYQIFRSLEDGPFAELDAPQAGTQYLDSDLENGRNYRYQVQAINSYEQGQVISVMSQMVTAQPTDQTPPPQPLGVQALRVEVGVKVFWDTAQASDLAGYRVYRRAGHGPAIHVGTVDVPYTIFVDENAPQGKTLFYSVSSIDLQNPANESQKSAEARAIE